MKKESQKKLLAYKYGWRVMERYTQIWENLDSTDLKLMLMSNCNCHDPGNGYFEGIEEVVGCHEIWFDWIKNSSLSSIILKISVVTDDKEGLEMESRVKIYSPKHELLFDFLILHSCRWISNVIQQEGSFFLTMRKYESHIKNEKQVRINLRA